MKPSNIFMTGNWEDLIISTFEIDKNILEKYLPYDTELDLYHGKALLSTVAFTFSKVSFYGIKVPFHQQFGQLNFRIYVKSKIDGEKGVVFLKEFAPKPLIAFVASTFYNEPYQYKKIRSTKSILENQINMEYAYKNIHIQATANRLTRSLKENTLEHFIVDRYIAFIKGSETKTYQYTIGHKPWKLYNVKTSYTDDSVLSLLPHEFNNAKLISTYFVDGSEVTVRKGVLQQSNMIQNIVTAIN
ncbi:MAG: hypothetical protein COA50_14260 [Flavobacteriaceae bacterium]|nr:MAG: hypothetical protein COA50_14260 [Flavobacteriaceae bacterium]